MRTHSNNALSVARLSDSNISTSLSSPKLQVVSHLLFVEKILVRGLRWGGGRHTQLVHWGDHWGPWRVGQLRQSNFQHRGSWGELVREWSSQYYRETYPHPSRFQLFLPDHRSWNYYLLKQFRKYSLQLLPANNMWSGKNRELYLQKEFSRIHNSFIINKLNDSLAALDWLSWSWDSVNFFLKCTRYRPYVSLLPIMVLLCN